jgi:hypothetical protein
VTPEGQKPSELNNILTTTAIIGGILILSEFAFSRSIRKQIHARDEVDVWDGTVETECAHITHDKSDPMYNDPSNGRLLSKRNHYLDHYNREGRNGLTKAGNDWALVAIWNRLTEEEREGLPSPPEDQKW